MNLFESVDDKKFQPPAEKLRPQTLKDFVGQEKILSTLGKMIDDGRKLPLLRLLRGIRRYFY